ncbi:GNAT family N-acetyltransferase [Nocardioides sp. SLBN-35]|uniref:GNAT family N-acetyltransferase n=1 Tax=Nocardioides sp. SLBN-35 TaxID=2768445 RepID=UPI00116E7263|nr:GNAT family N-acetyltransferase [Nocardioides sp. SLBN-35]TQK69361.1 RimJ/RimL family protein N-acetyltransferase [Nocardioides sp. SLBN-35]
MPDLSGVVLRPLSTDDAPAMARLHVAVWDEAYAGLVPESILAERRADLDGRTERWRRTAATSPAATTVAVHDGELVGFVSVGPGRDADLDLAEELWALYVRAAWWGHGLGHRMLAATLADRPAYLWVLAGNDRALAFYRRQGFAPDGVERHEPEGRELRLVRGSR